MKTAGALLLCAVLGTAAAQPYNYYAGNLHAHTAYSDGNKDRDDTGVNTPKGSYAFAKKSKHFDFLGISEHNHSSAGMKDKKNYFLGMDQADKENAEDFVCLYGMEYGVIKGGGHVLIYGVKQLIGWEGDDSNQYIECPKSDYDALWDILAAKPEAFATLAHPEVGDFNGLLNRPYNKDADKVICGVAVMTGPAFAENTDYDSEPAKKFINYFRGLLAAGYHVGPTVDHDNHYLTFGRMASSRTVVLANTLDRASVREAFKEMRFYATTDWNVKVSFELNGQPMGKRVNTRADAVMKVSVTDPDSGDGVESIKVMYGEPGSQEMSRQLYKSEEKTLTYTHQLPADTEYYYYLEITQDDGDKIYTAPIWVRRVR